MAGIRYPRTRQSGNQSAFQYECKRASGEIPRSARFLHELQKQGFSRPKNSVENVFGGITERMREKAREIADFSRLRIRDTIISKAAFQEGTCPPKKIALKRDPRLPMCGALLSRTYRGRRIVVKVLDDAFEFEGRKYSALSGIARDVTGTNWNGFKFFNL